MVGDRPAYTVGISAIERLGLAVGMTTAGCEDALSREEAICGTYDRAVMMLAARGRSAKDLERRLIRKGEPAEFVRLAIERLASEGFLDDEAYARSFVRSKSSGSGTARKRLQQELARAGVDRAVSDSAIEEVFADENVDEVADAAALATKRMLMLRSADPATARRRTYAFLARRGYSASVISKALAAAASDESSVHQGQ
jgi:regulatory protein